MAGLEPEDDAPPRARGELRGEATRALDLATDEHNPHFPHPVVREWNLQRRLSDHHEGERAGALHSILGKATGALTGTRWISGTSHS
eukprot:7717247-Pyramimonas_sp.AAC.1